ncbi:MAG TPA: SAM-dependent methyltransferase, partial [Polyangia bacterium]|nr:SAM-dependent methyltransferase [Polyangia bacterium]
MGASEEVRSRGGEKLEAAVGLFALGAAVKDGAAVDVGASTGGFTAALLRHGARSVVAVDVGHGQLHPSLRADPRVTSLEGADWKKLALSQAAGPFDFFTVDVSFVAARSMLRALAFRLRDGAQGVVLVKPQFELPSNRVRDGAVADPNLRRAALDRFREKAGALGFELCGAADSPVSGGSGTIEILTWLRFGGRPATMPRPGERRERPATRARPGAAADAIQRWSWFAIAAPGLEDVAAGEVAALPDAPGVRRVDGGVEFEGPLALGLRANLWLRTATRVVARLGAARARDFNPLRRALARLPWERFVGAKTTVKISASASRCRLYHTGALAETAALAIADRVKGWRPVQAPEAERESANAPAPLTILLRGVDDTFTASVDS